MQVTTIIPAYNAAEYVATAIESALEQKAVSQQIIVIDDGSTDATPRVLENFGERIEVIRQDNLGLSAARNAGIQAARGELIAFLDADDVWCDNKLAKQVAILRDNPEVAMVHSRTVSWDAANGRENDFVKAPSKDYRDDCFSKLYESNAICVSSVMVRTSCLQQIGGFDERIVRPTTQDYDLWLRIAFQHRLEFIDDKGVLYRRHSSNASQQIQMMLEDQIYVIQKALSYGHSRLQMELGQRQCWMRLANLYFELGYWHYGIGEIGLARDYFRKAVRHGHRDSHSVLLAFLPKSWLARASRRHRMNLSK